MTKHETGYALAVDVGGTFVDLTLCNLESGQRWVKKVLSDVGPQKAFIRGVEEICADADIAPGAIGRVVHGLTLATNAILEQSNPHTAVLVTAGFGDVLEIGRHDAPRGISGSSWLKARRPIGRDRIVEVEERIGWDGEVLTALSDETIDYTLARLAEMSPKSVAICLLHAHRRPDHERMLCDRIHARFPTVHVTASHDVLPQAGEYEKFTAAALNAYTMPVVAEYPTALEADLRAMGVTAPLYIMASDGGVLSAADARRLPIQTALSGPAGGASGAAAFARAAGEPRIVTLDVGGTSSDVACAIDGEVDVTVTGEIGPFPLALPVLDVHTVGAGGGSIARVRAGRFTVGPESAGSRPGPVSYRRGGSEPTVTDALLILGWLPEQLAGGALTLDTEAARAAVTRYVAEPLSLDLTSAAAGIVRLANANMAAAIRHISTERGRDPRDYALVPFGGAGGLHALEVARQIGIPRVLVPPAAGVFTTEGLLAADLSRPYVSSFAQPQAMAAVDVGALERMFQSLEGAGTAWLEGVPPQARRLRRLLDLRYANQGYELIIELDPNLPLDRALAQAEVAFAEAYSDRYGYDLPGVAVQIVSARVVAQGVLAHAARSQLSASSNSGGDHGTRAIYFDQAGWAESAVVDRSTLKPGDRIEGPAVIEEYDTTTVMTPGSVAEVRPDGTLVISFEGQHA